MTDLETFEAASDAFFASLPLPHPNGYASLWYLLTVSEDSQRWLFSSRDGWANAWKVEHYQDRFKFSLRSCLARVRRDANDWSTLPIPERALELLYVRTQKLLIAGIDYSVASQICASAHEGSARIVKKEGEFKVELIEQRMDSRYGALEAMSQSSGDLHIPFSMLFWCWIQEVERRPEIINAIAESTRLKARHIRYHYDPAMSYLLSQQMPQSPFLIPDEWRFPWGGRTETTLLTNAISLRSLYHLVAVQFGASKYRLRGAAEHDLCLCLSREEWLHDIELNSSVEWLRIAAFVDWLTFGFKTRSPDQALQPFIPLGDKRFGFPAIGWLSSNVERNLLSLHARLEPKTFNAQSALFEKLMIRSLLSVIEKKWPLVVANRRLTLMDGQEEFDLLICEPQTKTLVILELRWMLPPADPREVQMKKQACHQKVDQVERKAAAASRNVSALLQAAFGSLELAENEWTVYALVVIDGFGGALSLKGAIPVVPDWVLKAGAAAAPTLRRLADWARSLEWLPVQGRDFEVTDSEPHLPSVKVRYPGLVPMRTGRDYLRDATSLLA